MFEESQKITDMVHALYAACAPLSRGDVLAHEIIQAIVGVERHTEHWQWCVMKLRRRMETERGISMWPAHAVGYKLCTVAEQLDLPRLRQIRARRQIKRGLRSVKALPTKGLSVHERRVQTSQIMALEANHRAITADLHRAATTMRATITLPRRTAAQPTTQPAKPAAE